MTRPRLENLAEDPVGILQSSLPGEHDPEVGGGVDKFRLAFKGELEGLAGGFKLTRLQLNEPDIVERLDLARAPDEGSLKRLQAAGREARLEIGDPKLEFVPKPVRRIITPGKGETLVEPSPGAPPGCRPRRR